MTEKREKDAKAKHEEPKGEKAEPKVQATEPTAQAKPTDELAKAREALQRESEQGVVYKDALQRLQAEFENYRKRMVREQTQYLERAVEGFVLQLLPIIDNLERAIAAAEEKHDLEKLAGGVAMVHSQIVDLFGKEGIEIIDPEGEPFDPTMHHAMMQVEDDEHEDDTVVEVVQKGYSVKGKIIRPAMVKVSKRP